MSARAAGREVAGGLGLLGPDAVEVAPRSLRVGGRWCRTLAVTGYPKELGPGWLEPLGSLPGLVDVSVHAEPVPPAIAADRLRRQLARLESGARLDAERGRLADHHAEAARHDAHELASRLARGEGRLFRVGVYVTVAATDPDELDAASAQVRALLASMLLDAHPASYRMLHGFVSASLPLGVDRLQLRRTFDTQALAASFPFASAELPTADGVLYGRNLRSGGLVWWDRWGCPNYNQVVLARSGAGKSYLAKLETLRWLYHGVEVAIVDPEDEYRLLAAAVGGAHLALGAAGVTVNPFDLDGGPDALTRRALFAHSLVAVMLGRALDPATAAALDRAVIGCYHAAGISTDPRTHTRPAPLLADLAATLQADADPAARALAAQLGPYLSGSHRGLFAAPTSTRPGAHLVVWSLKQLPDELKPVGTLLALDAVWRRVADPARRRRRLVVVDEAWLLMQDPAGARFLARLAKSARKHWCGLTVISQDAPDLLATPLGQATVTNAATQILLAQAPQAIDQLTKAFKLTAGEQAFLLGARTGEGLLAAGAARAAFRAEASPAEHRLVTTDPAELAAGEGRP